MFSLFFQMVIEADGNNHQKVTEFKAQEQTVAVHVCTEVDFQ